MQISKRDQHILKVPRPVCGSDQVLALLPASTSGRSRREDVGESQQVNPLDELISHLEGLISPLLADLPI